MTHVLKGRHPFFVTLFLFRHKPIYFYYITSEVCSYIFSWSSEFHNSLLDFSQEFILSFSLSSSSFRWRYSSSFSHIYSLCDSCSIFFVRIYNSPLTKLSTRLFYPNLGVLFNSLGPLVPLGPLGLMGPHVLVTRVWVTPIEANFHWIHLHASF